jgi:hypothetical protein
VFLIAWLARGAIAANLMRAWLRDHGVASQLGGLTVSPHGLTARVRLGERSDPDITIERLEAAYDLTGPWEGRRLGVKVRRLRLVRPWARLRLGPGRPLFGALQPLLDEIAKQPGGPGPGPDITIEDGQLLMLTADGTARITGDAQVAGGVLRSVSGDLGPLNLSLGGGMRLTGTGGPVKLSGDGGRMKVSADLRSLVLGSAERQLRAGRLQLSGAAPFPGKDGRWSGPVALALTASSLSAFAGVLQGASGGASADLTGDLDADRSRQTLVGALTANGRFGVVLDGQARGRNASLDLDLPHLALRRQAAQMAASGDGTARLAADGGERGGLTLSGLASQMRIGGFEAQVDGNEGTSATATLDGDLAAAVAAGPPEARRLARKLPLLSGEPRYSRAAERAMHGLRLRAVWHARASNGDLTLRLAGPATISAASGARLTLADVGGVRAGHGRVSGGADLALSGSGLPELKAQVRKAAYSNGRFEADVATQGALELLFARGATLEARGRLSASPRQTRFDLTRCASVTAERLAFDPNAVTGFSGSVCPRDGPAILAGPGGWRVAGGFRDARGDLASLDTRFRRLSGAFDAAGPTSGVGAVAIKIDDGWTLDARQPVRFNPVQVHGSAELAHSAWTGAFALASGAGHPIGTIRLRHDLAAGVGRADIEASGLAFAENGLQPAELTPMAGAARQADGATPFTGWFAWAPGRPAASGGELVLRDARFSGAFGPVSGLSADIRFDSLAPLTTPPDQALTIAEVRSLVPMTQVSATFALHPHGVAIESAKATLAEGIVSLEPAIVPFSQRPAFTAAIDFEHVNVGELIAASNLASAVQLQASLDGRIPFAVEGDRVTITNGRLAATGPGRLTISRKALSGATATKAVASGQAAFAQELAYQAMEDLAFDQLDATLNSQPNERLGVLFHIKGRHDPPTRAAATITVSDLIAGKALAKPLPLPSDTMIDLTLDTSLNFGELVRGLGQAWRDSIANARSAPVQGPPREVASP